MEPCPSCFQNVEILESHYGTLYTCPHCQAVFFVGWDGKPEVAAHAGNSVPETIETPTEFPSTSYEPQPETSFESAPGISPMEVQADPVVEAPKTNLFQDVVDFGNSVNVEGTLSYTVHIQGIDHSSVLQQMKDQLDDLRLGWKIDDVLVGIKNGELILPNLSPAKASVIIQRLRHLPLRLSWKQVLATV